MTTESRELAAAARRSAAWIREMEPEAMAPTADLLNELADRVELQDGANSANSAPRIAGLAEAWNRGYSFSHWQARGHHERDDVPDYLLEDLQEWNPYRMHTHGD